MKAEDAKKLTQDAIHSETGVIAKHKEYFYKYVEQAAQKGKSSVSVYIPEMSDIDWHMAKKITDSIRRDGFKATHQTGDQRDPNNSIEIEW